jgi:hypothetical protein
VDSASVNAMAVAGVYSWTVDADECVFSSSIAEVVAVSGDDYVVDDTICSYLTFFSYSNGEDSTGTAIDAST